MNYDLLSPISDRLAEDVKLSHFQTFGRSLKLHTSKIIPDLDKIDICVNCGGLTFEDLPESNHSGLRKWFKDKWVRMGPGGKIRGTCGGKKKGEGKPKCLPRSKAYSLGKKGRASAAARKRRKDPNPNRRGKAINVATKKKS